jgi:hypothetical protein
MHVAAQTAGLCVRFAKQNLRPHKQEWTMLHLFASEEFVLPVREIFPPMRRNISRAGAKNDQALRGFPPDRSTEDGIKNLEDRALYHPTASVARRQ